MIVRRTCILICILLAVTGAASATPGDDFTPDQYRAELDRLLTASQQLNSPGTETPDSLHGLPHIWYVHIGDRDYDISTEGLTADVRRYDTNKTLENAESIQVRLQSLRADLDGFERDTADISSQRSALSAILSRPEFRNVRGPGWLDRLKQRLLEFLIHLLGRVFGSSAIPTIGKYFVYALIGLAGFALLYVAYRSILGNEQVSEVVPKDVPVSAKEWTIWLSEARAAAAKGEWRDAVHLAYWAGISFLERQGCWKPDRARTPREYLRLMSAVGDERETLSALTRIFELTWYAKRDANEHTFSQTLAQLEKLGCR